MITGPSIINKQYQWWIVKLIIEHYWFCTLTSRKIIRHYSSLILWSYNCCTCVEMIKKRAIICSCSPSTWNSLPVNLRTASTVTLFKKMLKTFFSIRLSPHNSSEIRRPVDDLRFDSRHWAGFDLDSAPLSSHLRGFRRYRSYRIELNMKLGMIQYGRICQWNHAIILIYCNFPHNDRQNLIYMP